MAYFSTLFISLLLTIVAIPPLTRLAIRFQLLDVPDERKAHAVAVPRCGGVAMAFGALTPTAYWFGDDPFIFTFLVAASCIVVFGIADDFFGLRPRWKFVGQIVAALVVIFWGSVRIESLGVLLPEGVLLPPGVSVPLTLLVIVGVTNAVNLADGLDGLAGGISLLTICFVGYLAVITGHTAIAVASLALAGAIFGFLRFNTHPASIFMGDSGSQLLGFAGITFALALSQQSAALSPLVPLLLFGLPVLDTLTVMTTRIMRGRSPFAPDRRHFHHRLLEIGLGHAEAVVAIYLLQALLMVLTFVLRFQSGWLLLAVYGVFALVVLGFFHYARRAGWRQKRWLPLDRAKLWVKTIRGQRRVLAVAFPVFEYGLYVLVLCCSLLTPPPERLVMLGAVGLGGAILLGHMVYPNILGRLIRVIFFMCIPWAVYQGDAILVQLTGGVGDQLVSILFILLFSISIVVSFFSTRQKGIWSTPLDFLILLMMIILPNMAGISYHNQRLGIIGLKCIILIVCFEVLMSEKRGDCKGMARVMALALVVYGGRFFF
jgi:UDP-GlcNAc:undecaprenyl-phosphate GlcNAc-1-phosphate transferase